MDVLASIKNLAKTAGKFINKNSPAILSGVAIVGVITTAVLAVKATPEAIRGYEHLKKREKKGEKVTKFDIFRECAPDYIPAILTAVVTIGCIVASNRVSTKRLAAMTALYSASDKALTAYKDKVEQMFGKNKAQKVKDELAGDKILKDPPNGKIFSTGHGTLLCYEAFTGRYFESDQEKIRQQINSFNEALIHDCWLSLNDLYDFLGLDPNRIGNEMGWDINHEGTLKVEFSSKLTENGLPCLVMDYAIGPRPYRYE